VEYFSVDDESDPSKATENANKLIKRDKVDVLVGTVHSGVALAMAKVARENKTLFLVANAGADELTGPLCAPTLFRTSFSAWQPAYAMGKVVADKGHKRVVTLTWKYSFGQQSIDGFKESFEKGGGKIINISSTTGYGGTYPEAQDTVAYNASKGAVMVLTKDLAVKWARYNIHVNGIAPGPFVTHMTEKHFANVGEDVVKGANPLGRFGTEWDLKGAVVFLASAASDFITGATIPVDGGSHALA